MVLVSINTDIIIKQRQISLNSKLVNDAVKRYTDKKDRRIFGKQIKKDAKKAGDYLSAFGIINKFYGLTKEQQQCFEYIRHCDKN